MMDRDKVKLEMSKEIGSLISTIDPALDFDTCFMLYLEVLKYELAIQTKNNLDGLEVETHECLQEIFVGGILDNMKVGSLARNFEPFIKKLYYVLEENEFVNKENVLDREKRQALGPFISALNKIRPIYLDANNKDVYEKEEAEYVNDSPKKKINDQTGGILYKKLIPKKISISIDGVNKKIPFEFDDYQEFDSPIIHNRLGNTFLLYFTQAVMLKNEQSHQTPSVNKLQFIQKLTSTLIAELWIIHFFKRELASSFKKSKFKNNDLNSYVDFEIEKLKNKNKKFVSLSLKEVGPGITGTNMFIEDILNKKINRLRILGQGGSGKTTTLEYLVYNSGLKWKSDPQNNKMPVLISLGGVPDKETIIQSVAKKINCSLEVAEELIEGDEIILYLDGVNEIVSNRESKKRKLQEISSIMDEFESLSVIITDRYEFDSYQSNMFGLPTFLIDKLNDNQIIEFVGKYCHHLEEQSKQVLQVLESKHKLKKLFSKPLVLSRAIEIIKEDNDLPDKEGKIIEKFIDTLLRREKDEKMDPLLNINNFKMLMSYAANRIWNLHNSSNGSVHEFTFNKILNEGADKFGLERFNAGYISRIGYELEILAKHDDAIQFYHQSYIEFFAAYYLKYEVL